LLLLLALLRRSPISPLFPTRRSSDLLARVEGRALARVGGELLQHGRDVGLGAHRGEVEAAPAHQHGAELVAAVGQASDAAARLRSEEHTSELQSLTNLVCRLLLRKKN